MTSSAAAIVRPLTPEEQSLVDLWCAELPPMIARKAVEHHLGGITTRERLAQEDSRGTGPAGLFYVGRDVMYPTRNLVTWLVTTRGVRLCTRSRATPRKRRAAGVGA